MQPAQAIVDNFEKAKEVSATSHEKPGAYLPVLNQYHPGLIERCHNAQKMSKEIVSSWLEQYMYKGQQNAKERAKKTADKLADHSYFKSHYRHIDKKQASDLGLDIKSLEDDERLQDLVLSVFHATTIMFRHGSTKIIENGLGRAFMKQSTQPPSLVPPS